jgi:hypothetical protein
MQLQQNAGTQLGGRGGGGSVPHSGDDHILAALHDLVHDAVVGSADQQHCHVTKHSTVGLSCKDLHLVMLFTVC